MYIKRIWLMSALCCIHNIHAMEITPAWQRVANQVKSFFQTDFASIIGGGSIFGALMESQLEKTNKKSSISQLSTSSMEMESVEGLLYRTPESVNHITINEQFGLLFTAQDYKLTIYDLHNPSKEYGTLMMEEGWFIRSIAVHYPCIALAISSTPQLGKVLVGTLKQSIHDWSVINIHALQGHNDWAVDVQFSPDGKLLASISDDRSIHIWETATWTRKHILQAHTHWGFSLSFNCDGTLLASGGFDGMVHIWDPHAGKCLQSYKTNYHGAKIHQYTNIVAVSFHPHNPTQLFATSKEGVVSIDTKTQSIKDIFQKKTPHKNPLCVSALHISADGQEIFMKDCLNNIHILNLAKHQSWQLQSPWNSGRFCNIVSTNNKTQYITGYTGFLNKNEEPQNPRHFPKQKKELSKNYDFDVGSIGFFNHPQYTLHLD